MRLVLAAFTLVISTSAMADTLQERDASWSAAWETVLRNGGKLTESCTDHCSKSVSGTDGRGRPVFLQIDYYTDGSRDRDYCRVGAERRDCTDWDTGGKKAYFWSEEDGTWSARETATAPPAPPAARDTGARPDYVLSVEVLMAAGSPDQIWQSAEIYIAAHAGEHGKACAMDSCTYNYISTEISGRVIETSLRAEGGRQVRELCTVTTAEPMQRHCINVDTRNISDWRVANKAWVPL